MFLSTCSKLQPTVDIKTIIVGLVDRLATFASQNPGSIPAAVDVFKVFSERIVGLIEVSSDLYFPFGP